MAALRLRSPEFFIFFSIWMIFQFNGLIDGALIGRSGVPSWLIMLVFLVAILFFDGRRTLAFDKYSFLFFVLFVSCLPSFLEFYNFYSLSVFSIVICIFISSSMRKGWVLSSGEKQVVFNVSIIVALLSILMFLYFVFIDRPVFGQDLIRPGYGYAIDRGVLLRLVGFADDPNFYVLAMIFPLLLMFSEKKIKYRKVGGIIILASLLLTFSRSGLIAVVVGILAFYIKKISFRMLAWAAVSVVLSLLISALYGFVVSELKTNEDVVVERSFSSGFDSRNNLLSLALMKEDFSAFGNGIGRAKDIIGIHSHNSYFDYIFDSGYVPFSILAIILLFFFTDLYRRPSIFSAYAASIVVGAAALSIPFQPMLILMIMCSHRYGTASSQGGGNGV
ncbi:hypothetical protein [Spongiibacter tropicus]|uniref:hypothetical protein n=1 Tax=Spongiibacter tropicus TaxID=454602 RepID=UPI0003B4A388|nr:hypothetical protein [Spongiibacter tropicus]